MILITDLDHTLANSSWRDEHRGNWDLYHELSKEDKPITAMIHLVNALSFHFQIVCITTRPEKWRQLTMNWLLKHEVVIHRLLMRGDNDFSPSPKLKVALARPLLYGSTVVAIDDREDVLAAYASLGIKALLRKL